MKAETRYRRLEATRAELQQRLDVMRERNSLKGATRAERGAIRSRLLRRALKTLDARGAAAATMKSRLSGVLWRGAPRLPPLDPLPDKTWRGLAGFTRAR